MTFKEFINLDSDYRGIICWSRGRKVAERYDGNHYYMLYQLDSFYIEIRVSQHYEVILDYCAFESTDELNAYLSLIDISELVGNFS